MATEKARDLCKRFGQLKSKRTTWENHWEEIAERVLPSYSEEFFNDSLEQRVGEKRTSLMFDATAPIALERFAATMESMLTPRNNKWHRLVPSDPVLLKDREVRLWFEDVTTTLFKFRYAPKANYASQQHEAYMSLGGFGTACLFIDEAETRRGLRYRATSLADTYIATNHQGVVDTVFRPLWLSARQAVQKWGQERLSEKLVGKLSSAPDETFEFLHVVMPRDDVDASKADFRRMPFASIYIEVEQKEIVDEGGYETFPYPISRYVTAPNEMYGRSPAMLALPAIKVLNEQKKTMLKQGHRVVDPVILANDDGILDTFSLKPGAVNFGAMTRDGRRLVDVLPTGNLAAGQELMDAERATINDVFLVTLFQILVETPQMTATEVLERAREKGALISPTVGRQQSEMLGPLIERELDILARQGLLPEMPPALIEAEGEYEIEYDSPLSRAQRAEEGAGLMRSMEFALTYSQATGDPAPLDWFDMDSAMPDLMDINAVPVKWVSSLEKVEELRQARAQQQQAQQAIEAAPAVSGALKAASNAE